MNLIDIIPIGKEHRQTRQELIYKAKMTEDIFKNELAKLKKKYVILYDNGYYLPSTKEEYLEFIQKKNNQLYETTKIIDLAYKEMGDL